MIDYSLERDNYKNFELFEIVPIKVKNQDGVITKDERTYESCIKLPSDTSLKKCALFANQPVLTYGLKLK
jgi:hypothetical protein